MAHWYGDPQQFSALRKRLNISQVELAKTANVTQGYVSQIEKGITPFVDPSRSRLWEALAKIEVSRNGYPPDDGSDKSVPLFLLAHPTPETFDTFRTIQLLTGLKMDKTPEERQREEIERLKAENKLQAERLSLQQELIDIIEKRDESWYKPLDEKLQAGAKRIAELEQLLGRTFDLLGIETEEGILRFRKEEVQEEIKEQYKSLPESPDKV